MQFLMPAQLPPPGNIRDMLAERALISDILKR